MHQEICVGIVVTERRKGDRENEDGGGGVHSGGGGLHSQREYQLGFFPSVSVEALKSVYQFFI